MGKKIERYIVSELPKKMSGGREYVDWNALVGRSVDIFYDGEIYSIEVLDYKNPNITLRHFNNTKTINTSAMKKCAIGSLIGKIHMDHIHSEGDTLTNNFRSIKLTKQIRVNGYKYYEYKCLVCGHVDRISEGNITIGHGCNVCSGQKVIKEINSLWKTHNELTIFFKNIEDSYKYGSNSGKKILLKCPICGEEKEMAIDKFVKKSFNCPRCGSTKSYGERIMYNLLKMCGINFIYDNSFIWSNKKRYDFYIPSMNTIIEINGIQHYKYTNRGKTLKEEVENDKEKHRLAIENGINNYIVIDCSKSDFNYIKDSIVKNLDTMINVSKIDWLLCHRNTCMNDIEEICRLWNEGVTSTKDIAKNTGNNYVYVREMLKIGNESGLVDYNVDIARKLAGVKISKSKYKKVKCLNTGNIFNSLFEASEYYKISFKGISNCCLGKSKSSGKDENGIPLRWEYVS